MFLLRILSFYGDFMKASTAQIWSVVALFLGILVMVMFATHSLYHPNTVSVNGKVWNVSDSNMLRDAKFPSYMKIGIAISDATNKESPTRHSSVICELDPDHSYDVGIGFYKKHNTPYGVPLENTDMSMTIKEGLKGLLTNGRKSLTLTTNQLYNVEYALIFVPTRGSQNDAIVVKFTPDYGLDLHQHLPFAQTTLTADFSDSYRCNT